MNMKIKDLTINRLEIPFKHSFEHHSAKRQISQSVLVTAVSQSLVKGFGEGCPREYVTGEDYATAERFFEQHRQSLWDIHSLSDIQCWSSQNRSAIDDNPSAWCAIEMAMLDLLGKVSYQTVEVLLSKSYSTRSFGYTGVIGVSSQEVFEKTLKAYLSLGIRDFKIKLSGNLHQDNDRLKLLVAVDHAKVRVDANNLWRSSSEAIDYIKALCCPVWAVEEPLNKVGQYTDLLNIAKVLDVKIILDESFTRIDQMNELVTNKNHWILNLRLSKLGGLLRTLTIAERANQLCIPMIVGSHVGETSLLARAALVVAGAFAASLVAQEGAFSTYLLTKDIVTEPIRFGHRGRLPANLACFEKPGFGLDVIF